MRVPGAFAEATIRREGPPGKAWIDGLPELIGTMLREWELTADGEVLHGHVAVVLPVRRAGGGRAALKVAWPDQYARREPVGLRAWAGRGGVRLLRQDTGRAALLLERLRPSVSLEHRPVREALSTAARVLRLLHSAPPPRELPSVAEEQGPVAGEISRSLPGRPRWQSSLLEAAAGTFLRAGPARGGEAVLLHGDFHYANVLADDTGRWKATDPKPCVGPREYDLLPLLRNRWTELPAGDPGPGLRHRLRILAACAGLDPGAAAEWCRARAAMDALAAEMSHDHGFAARSWAIAGALPAPGP
ncbi:aminoglycoside phosphotransferase family protein [Streptomyces aidingensis]|uniref:Streptomycin 6-kinase n=1 Tax=Streptomyces aidingensis TaxID=910347 RepID=A0A1I1N342_9ACTN|nr:aminoglycoside phosphotransferase family protein [Streptomyces aidingensis]SFC89263.1 streptomycin 6-kinase [Streptomyces aidingensis]